MASKKKLWTGVLCVFGLLVLVLDSKTATTGAKEGILLCLYTVIPSLFPFIFLSILLAPILVGNNMKLLRPIGRICGVPEDAEPLLLLGFLGGYPVGAQAITDAWESGRISRASARRMLGFCSNAGPSFLFGMGAALFENMQTVWILWAIHILSALTVGMILPHKRNERCKDCKQKNVNLISGLEKSIKVMASICGWVILFRVMLTFMDHWIFWCLPADMPIIVTGLTELANGCIESSSFSTEAERFVWMAFFLGFGGICVLAQTASVTHDLGLGAYFPGKVLHSCMSFLLAYSAQFLLFSADQQCKMPPVYILLTLALALSAVIFLHRKKTVAFRNKIVYNDVKFTT